MTWPDVPWDISDGMVKLLEFAALRRSGSGCAVITTVPDLWLYNGSSEPLLILDVSSLVGSIRVVSHQEIVRDIITPIISRR